MEISIKGRGVYDVVSTRMTTAIIILGIFGLFDSMYGSLAGIVVRAYMVSRQICVNVYTEVLITAKKMLVHKGRLLSYIASRVLEQSAKDGTLRKMSIRQ